MLLLSFVIDADNLTFQDTVHVPDCAEITAHAAGVDVYKRQDPKFGGDTPVEQTVYKAVKKECDGRDYSFGYPLPAYGVAVFLY